MSDKMFTDLHDAGLIVIDGPTDYGTAAFKAWRLGKKAGR